MDEIPMTFDPERDCWIAHTPSLVGEVVLHSLAQKAYRIQMDRLKSAPASATAEANRPIRLLKNEIAERKRLKRKIAADKRIATLQRRKAEEAQILALYALVRKAA